MLARQKLHSFDSKPAPMNMLNDIGLQLLVLKSSVIISPREEAKIGVITFPNTQQTPDNKQMDELTVVLIAEPPSISHGVCWFLPLDIMDLWGRCLVGNVTAVALNCKEFLPAS